MKLTCGAYARYSDSKQNPRSIDGQFRLSRERAAKEDWEPLEHYFIYDTELSGSGGDRPGWMRLQSVIEQNPRPFDILLVDDTSRLTRNRGDNAKFTERLKFLGIRLIVVSQGIDTDDEQSDLMLAIHGITDDLYIKELAQKTRRGLIETVERGFHTGGRCYGYDNIAIDDGRPRRRGETLPARLQINENEAQVIIRIFVMFADGASLKAIAKALNADHVPSPRPRARKRYATWCPSAIREMLRRELYVGRVVWNKSRFIKKPNTNTRIRRPRPESEWRRTERPELRIIDEDLWQRVQTRLAQVAEKYNYFSRPGLLHRAMTSPYLLTGFMKCGSCGADLTIVEGRGKGRHPRYGCPQNSNRGACANNVKQRADVIEQCLFSELQEAVLQPEAIAYALEEFERQLVCSLDRLGDKIGLMRQRSEQLEQELRNLVLTVASCGPSPKLVEAINSREQELKDISRQLLSAEPDSVSSEVGRIREFVTDQLGDIRQILGKDVRKAKAELGKHVTEIRMTPVMTGKKGHYEAEGVWNLMGGYKNETPDARPEGIRRIGMVAGARFELATFGL